MDYITILVILNAVVFLGQIALGLLLKNYLPAYATEKGKNLATKEDIEEITRKVEGVKDEFAKSREEIAHQNRQLLDSMNRRHQLRLAALDKRLEVHQEAYTLWWKLVRTVYDKDRIREVANECQEFWVQNCLYLDEDARHAFRVAYHAAFNHRELRDAREDPEVLEESWERIQAAGDVIRKAVELPSLGEDEYKPLKDGEEKEG